LVFVSSMIQVLASGCKGKAPIENNVEHKVVETQKSVPKATMDELMANFARVHFETDSSQLTADAKVALQANAQILQTYPELKVEIQGHADERGTTDYNLALGQRRANSVVSFMTSQGVATSRLPVVTYGEERPLDDRSGEVAWAQNRRAEFRVLAGAAPVQGTTVQ
jgi:peptidoglycan-associated lipoprotein